MALVLLMVFVLPLAVKGLHVCQQGGAVPVDMTHTVVYKTPAHDAATCPVCQFSFLSFDKAHVWVFQALTFVAMAVAIGYLATGSSRRQVAVVSLRAPPVL